PPCGVGSAGRSAQPGAQGYRARPASQGAFALLLILQRESPSTPRGLAVHIPPSARLRPPPHCYSADDRPHARRGPSMLAEGTKPGPYVSRSPRWGRTLVAAALSLAVGVPALAGTTGRLIGRVVDEKELPLPGVSIRIEGQRLGAITDDRGTYFILGIPGGHCTVRMSLIGYAAFAAANVEIAPDFSTTLDATLKTEAAQVSEGVVDAERPLLQKDATGTVRFLSGNEIQRLPTRGYREALAQEPGVVNIVRQIDLEGTNSNTLVLRGGLP